MGDRFVNSNLEKSLFVLGLLHIYLFLWLVPCNRSAPQELAPKLLHDLPVVEVSLHHANFGVSRVRIISHLGRFISIQLPNETSPLRV
jgi:hypothetical protein